MAAEQKVLQRSPSSSDTQMPKEAREYQEVKPSAAPPANDSEDENEENINYPPPWKWERFFIGGYNQSRMFKFKNPKTMYTAINLFAGVAIMFYGYDQGVMSQVNLNEDYWNHSMDAPIIEKGRQLTSDQWVSIPRWAIPETWLQKVASSPFTTVVPSSEHLLLDR